MGSLLVASPGDRRMGRDKRIALGRERVVGGAAGARALRRKGEADLLNHCGGVFIPDTR